MVLFTSVNIEKISKYHPGMVSHFKSLHSRFKAALEGKSNPNFYVIPWETGLGKSTFIKAFLAEWKSEGFENGGSVLIALNTKAEIEEFAAGCGLEAQDYSVYTSDEKLNELGRGSNNSPDARVLFTTHKMIRERLRKKKFNSAEEFYYKGLNRAGFVGGSNS